MTNSPRNTDPLILRGFLALPSIFPDKQYIFRDSSNGYYAIALLPRPRCQ